MSSGIRHAQMMAEWALAQYDILITCKVKFCCALHAQAIIYRTTAAAAQSIGHVYGTKDVRG